MDLGLAGRTALITGSGKGIGAATAQILAAEGAAVIVSDMDAAAAGETADAIRSAGGKSIGIACDVTRLEEVEALMAKSREAFGKIDVLVNNAGITRDASLLKMEESDWDAVMNVTLKAAFYCCRSVVPTMREAGWGRIINIASRSIFGNPGQTNYAAAKAGLVGFTRALSLEQARYGITVNALAPGFIETEGMKSLEGYEKLRDVARAKNPVGFLGDPRDVGAAIAFLASDQARYITGTTMFVTGGRFSS